MSDDTKNPLPLHAPYPGMPVARAFVTIFREELWKALQEGKIPGVTLENEPKPQVMKGARHAE